MKRLWGILVLILVCNVTSLVARISMLETNHFHQIECYIGEEGDDNIPMNHNQKFDFVINKSAGVSSSRTSTNENNYSKNPYATGGRFTHSEYHHWLHDKACLIICKDYFGCISNRIKDYYVYALRHIII